MAEDCRRVLRLTQCSVSCDARDTPVGSQRHSNEIPPTIRYPLTCTPHWLRDFRGPAEDCCLELTTLGYYDDARSARIGDVAGWPHRARTRPHLRCAGGASRRVSGSVSSRGAPRSRGSAEQLTRASTLLTSCGNGLRSEKIMRLICATSPRATEPRRSVLAHLPCRKRPAAVEAFRILHVDHRARLDWRPWWTGRRKSGRLVLRARVTQDSLADRR